MQQMPLTPTSRKSFLLGGNATFTLVSTKSGTRYTYRVQQADDNERLYFVKVLTGSDNTSDYTYLGTLRTAGVTGAEILSYMHGRKSHIGQDALCALAFGWFIGHMESHSIEMWHEGRCCVCGRVLTTPDSLSRGIGPECAKQHAMAA